MGEESQEQNQESMSARIERIRKENELRRERKKAKNLPGFMAARGQSIKGADDPNAAPIPWTKAERKPKTSGYGADITVPLHPVRPQTPEKAADNIIFDKKNETNTNS